MVSALPTNSNHFRRKYHNFQVYIFNCQFGQLPAKLKSTLQTADDLQNLPAVVLLAAGQSQKDGAVFGIA